MAINSEVKTLAPKVVQSESPDRTTRIFNADLTIRDAQDNLRHYLAESVPELGTDTWRALPDGRMETTWKLRPRLTWQDGQPLTSEDFVFAFQVYAAPGLKGVFGANPQDIIERVVAVDPSTIRIFWRSTLLHQGEGLTPLPRHILSESFATSAQNPASQADAFLGLSFWTTGYVGAGPYRLTHWEPGSYLEGEAFQGHALGKPKIDRIQIRFIDNTNTVLASILAGEVQLSLSQGIIFENAMTLKREAGFNEVEKKGAIVIFPQSTSILGFQLRSDYAKTPGILDLRVRRALAHTIDRDAINERLFEGQAPKLITFVPPAAPYYTEVDLVIAKYPYDPRRAEQLMNEAGYSKGSDGSFQGATGQRFQPALWTNADTRDQILSAILTDRWRAAGIDAQPFTMAATQQRDLEAVSTYPGIIRTTAGGNGLSLLDGKQIASPANRWGGSNRTGWSDPDFDLLLDGHNSTLDLTEQTRLFVQLMKIYSEQLPSYPVHFNLQVVAHVAALKGPEEPRSWNIHEWDWQ